MCPGLAFGIRAAEAALAEIGPQSEDEELVGIAETDMCAVDAIQFMTGCTFGKGSITTMGRTPILSSAAAMVEPSASAPARQLLALPPSKGSWDGYKPAPPRLRSARS
jgi:hypothetical protein